jgi:quercetin dioxygenase-like cupin family protein
MHYVGRFDEDTLTGPARHAGHSRGYSEVSLVDERCGSVHTGLSMNELARDGVVFPHAHSFEEGFYILSGRAVVSVEDRSYVLTAGDFGAVKVGTPHSWRNADSEPTRWLQMAAPQPKPAAAERDTFFLKDRTVPGAPQPLHEASAHGDLLGHFDAGQIPQGEDGRMAAGGLKGVFLKWLIDEKFGARHHRMLFIEYQPGVSIGLHDHTFEESYFILSGEVEATLDGRRYVAGPGTVLWTGVGCVHAFANTGSEPVRWLETFSPQPPAENVFRFVAEWEQRARDWEG